MSDSFEAALQRVRESHTSVEAAVMQELRDVQQRREEGAAAWAEQRASELAAIAALRDRRTALLNALLAVGANGTRAA